MEQRLVLEDDNGTVLRAFAWSGEPLQAVRRGDTGRLELMKSVDELKEIYGGKGITPERETIAYCRIGERSAHTWFVLTELLGYDNVRNYDGSWTEWGSLIKAPIER